MAAASELADIFLIVFEVAQCYRVSLNKDQSIDLVADFRRDLFEVATVRHAVVAAMVLSGGFHYSRL